MASWTYEEISREYESWGIDVIISFQRTTGEVVVAFLTFEDDDDETANGSDRYDAYAAKLELGYSILNYFDLGEGSLGILREGIVSIRNNPNVTFEQAQTWYDNNYPDAVWKSDKFFDKARDFLKHELGYVPTWDQFKTYVINNKFEVIDG